MLFLLTGDIQTGKTRWLMRAIGELEACGVVPVGVVAPGTWIEHRGEGGIPSYEKTGIDNELLPDHERIPFARRHDLACEEGTLDPASQASRAQLGWAIDDNAIQRVNAHFERLLQDGGSDLDRVCPSDCAGSPQADGACERLTGENAKKKRFLVIDEFGRLELLRGEGLTAAVRAIDRGATDICPHALVIVREQLLQTATERFADAHWGGMRAISPDDDSMRLLIAAYYKGALPETPL